MIIINISNDCIKYVERRFRFILLIVLIVFEMIVR